MPTEPPIEPIEALKLIRTFIGDLHYGMGEKAVDMTLTEVRRILDRSISSARRNRPRPKPDTD